MKKDYFYFCLKGLLQYQQNYFNFFLSKVGRREDRERGEKKKTSVGSSLEISSFGELHKCKYLK